MTNRYYYPFWRQLISYLLFAANAWGQVADEGDTLSIDYLSPNSYLIEEINVTGLQTLDAVRVIAHAGLKVGDKVSLPGAKMQHAIHQLLKLNPIQDIAIYASHGKPNPEEQKIKITIHVTEAPCLSTYTFRGVSKSEQKKLLEQISLVKGSKVTDNLIHYIQQTTQSYFIDKGHRIPKVTINKIPLADDKSAVQLEINIDKGPKQHVHAVYFSGNQHISSDELKSQMYHIREHSRLTLVQDVLKRIFTLQPLKKGSFLWRTPNIDSLAVYLRSHVILTSSKFSQTQLEKDKERIINYYRSQGFRDAAIVQENFEERKDGNLNIFLKVEEGQKYYIGDIRWLGNCIHDEATLSRILGIQKGDVYNPILLAQRLDAPEGQAITPLYADNGYLAFRLAPLEVGLEGNRITLAIRLSEGPLFHINKIIVENNQFTQEDVIRRELRTIPGDKFSRTKVIRSLRELAQLELFKPEGELPEILPNPDGTVDIKYKVKEDMSMTAKLGAGYTSEGFRLNLSLGHKNFSLRNLLRRKLPLGEGQTADIKVEANGKKYIDAAIQFKEPWLGGKKPMSLYLGLDYSVAGESSAQGGNIGLGTRLDWLDDYVVASSRLKFRHHQYQDAPLLDKTVDVTQTETSISYTGEKQVTKITVLDIKKEQLSTGTLTDLSFDAALERNSTDSPLYPKEGSKFVLNTSLTPPWSWFGQQKQGELPAYKEYHQWIADGAYFWNPFDKLVLHVRGQCGVLGKYPMQESIGPFERFFLGGSSVATYTLKGQEKISMRGYKDNYLTPKDPETGFMGGVLYDKLTAEVRYPLLNNPVGFVYALGFIEVGNTYASYKAFDIRNQKRAAGLGFRVQLPYLSGILLGFDWGYGFDKDPVDRLDSGLEFNFSFGLGR